ncbi:predicted protein [Streptomyces viridochromogenes DSM 40736]|uniref:Predicted protein n=1 Tax=Streptomyces viridochromogenes (strain DSM 40736 / JCM 4977 / BCRC 1201 / Tue 494) TaxID=591159 RepID=D9X0K5_STRVT|nr:hypothetical protein [Streptomyces viridochromogenes]EFL31269.1 predicted protein [Streptomyces viridochromogenes DSM 40736]
MLAQPVPENRPRLDAEQAASHTRDTCLGDWRPWAWPGLGHVFVRETQDEVFSWLDDVL